MRGHKSCLKEALDRGNDVEGRDGLHCHVETPLWRACNNGHEACARLLVAHGANLNTVVAMQVGILHAAAANGHTHLISWLLHECGLNIEVQTTLKETPLYKASAAGHTHCARELIRQGASVNGGGRTPFQGAAQRGHDGCMHLLLAHGAIPTSRMAYIIEDEFRYRPLFLWNAYTPVVSMKGCMLETAQCIGRCTNVDSVRVKYAVLTRTVALT